MSTSVENRLMVMIIDDQRDSRLMIRRALEIGNYRVVEASGGREALDILEAISPDVILLDVCMPEMSGYEVCEAIKARPATSKIPLIMVSAMADREALRQGFAAGAVDYLAKPAQPEELCARVAVHAELNRARRELEASHARLAALNHEKDLMFGMAAHDMRGPLGVIMGFSEVALSKVPDDSPVRGALEVIFREARQVEHFLGTLLDLEALERGGASLKARPLEMEAEVRRAVERAGPHCARKSLTLTLEIIGAEGSTRATADEHAVRRILDNLISNAVKFTPMGGSILVRVLASGQEIQCHVCDSGPGLTAQDIERVFTRFCRLSALPTGGEKSIGLGLAICRALAEGMGGRAWCGNKEHGGGAFFAFSVPAAAPLVALEREAPSRIGGHSMAPFPHLLADCG